MHVYLSVKHCSKPSIQLLLTGEADTVSEVRAAHIISLYAAQTTRVIKNVVVNANSLHTVLTVIFPGKPGLAGCAPPPIFLHHLFLDCAQTFQIFLRVFLRQPLSLCTLSPLEASALSSKTLACRDVVSVFISWFRGGLETL